MQYNTFSCNLAFDSSVEKFISINFAPTYWKLRIENKQQYFEF